MTGESETVRNDSESFSKRQRSLDNVELQHDNKQSDQNEDSCTSLLIPYLGRELSISCLLRCPRSYYQSLASVNRSFRSLIHGHEELFRLQRQERLLDYWIFFSYYPDSWDVFHLSSHRWTCLPELPVRPSSTFERDQPLALDGELLTLRLTLNTHHRACVNIYRYDNPTKTWCSDVTLNTPRYSFGYASFRGCAIVAGGCDLDGNVLSSAEFYTSRTGKWVEVPSMRKARTLCSAVFMDGKFYVLGGRGIDTTILMCGEVYDLELRTWSEIPNMSPIPFKTVSRAPVCLKVVVVNDVMYAADRTTKELKKYDKDRNIWYKIGKLPKKLLQRSMRFELKACGHRLVVLIEPPDFGTEKEIELAYWVPKRGDFDRVQWNLLATRRIDGFLMGFEVMECGILLI